MLVNNSDPSDKYNHSINSYSILLVDDEIDILSVIRRQLQEYGINACCFTKPSIALEHFKANSNAHPIVISDLQMPNINGFDFVRKVNEINSNVRVFLMTCFEISDLQLQNNSLTTKLLIDEFILKPFSIENLFRLINKHKCNQN
jgi:DNA-binding NtrC family response regulator